jgi:hypothetical protein
MIELACAEINRRYKTAISRSGGEITPDELQRLDEEYQDDLREYFEEWEETNWYEE